MKSYIKDYPRPQLVRQTWMNLNGQWDFAFDDENIGEKSGWGKGFETDLKIEVPFTYETRMSGIGREKAHEHIWYHRTVNVEKKDLKRYILHLEGSDYETKIWINGAFAGNHKGAYERASFDITEYLAAGENHIVIGVTDSYSIRQPRGKQRWMKDNFGCWYVQTGLVILYDPTACYIKYIKVKPDLENGSVKISAEFEGIPCSFDENNKSEFHFGGEISFEDNGMPFDPLAKADPDVTLSVEDRPIGGLGIFMVKKSMDDVHYEYKDGKNIFTMRKNLTRVNN